jgi:4-hydroxybenzoate polyprenyltransferase
MEFLKNISPYIKIVRPGNLLLIGITQCIFYHFVIHKLIDFPALDLFNTFLLILQTILIAAGGYVINDIKDCLTDQKNKPHKTYIPGLISSQNAKIYYYFLLGTGILVAIILEKNTIRFPILLIHLSLCLTLYWYAVKFKNSILLGNIIISIMVSLVSGIILLAERESIVQLADHAIQNIIISIFLSYMIFSFFVNLIREIIKDMEDMDGDQASGIITFPIRYGRDAGKKLCIHISVATLIFLLVWLFTTNISMELRSKSFLLLFVAAPLVILIQTLTNTTNKREFAKISNTLKWMMVSGLGSVIIISSEL